VKGRLAALLRQRCPRCRDGRVFRGILAMHEACPACGHRFEREPGYFVGAMYMSYALAAPLYLLLVLAIDRLRPAWTDLTVCLAATPLFLPFVPLIFRYSRLAWMHFDWAFDRGE